MMRVVLWGAVMYCCYISVQRVSVEWRIVDMSTLALEIASSIAWRRCRSDARGHGLFEARLPRVRPLEVRRAVGLDRSFVRQLWRPLTESLSAGATRPAANIIICHLAPCLEPLSRLPFHENLSLPENVHRTHSPIG